MSNSLSPTHQIARRAVSRFILNATVAFAACALVAAALAAPVAAQSAGERPPQVDRAQLFVAALTSGKGAVARTLLTDYAQRTWTATRLQEWADETTNTHGQYLEVLGYRTERRRDGYFSVEFLVRFGAGRRDVVVLFEDQQPDARIESFEVRAEATVPEATPTPVATPAPPPALTPLPTPSATPSPVAQNNGDRGAGGGPFSLGASSNTPTATPAPVMTPAPTPAPAVAEPADEDSAFYRYMPGPYEAPAAFSEHSLQARLADGSALSLMVAAPTNGGDEHPAIILLGDVRLDAPDGDLVNNRPLANLARGLASSGFTTIRVGATPTAGTPSYADLAADGARRDRWIGDVLATALDAARRDPSVDSAQVFVLGYGLTARSLPAVAAAQAAPPSGLVLVSPVYRGDVRDTQLEMSRIVRSDSTGRRAKAIAVAILEGVQKVAKDNGADASAVIDPKSLEVAALAPAEPIIPASLRDTPMLVMHGGRDLLVSAEDRADWRAALIRMPSATLSNFGTVNHLMIEAEFANDPTSARRQGFVAPQVVDEIANWMREQTGTASPTLDFAADEAEALSPTITTIPDDENEEDLMKFFVTGDDDPEDLPDSVTIIDSSGRN